MISANRIDIDYFVCQLVILIKIVIPCMCLWTVAVSENPVLKADAIKYLMVFRNQVCVVRFSYLAQCKV